MPVFRRVVHGVRWLTGFDGETANRFTAAREKLELYESLPVLELKDESASEQVIAFFAWDDHEATTPAFQHPDPSPEPLFELTTVEIVCSDPSWELSISPLRFEGPTLEELGDGCWSLSLEGMRGKQTLVLLTRKGERNGAYAVTMRRADESPQDETAPDGAPAD